MDDGGIRRVVIDDTHPSIVYSTNPPWTLDTTSFKDEVGTFGEPLNETLHGMYSNGSFTFSFYGTSIGVYGTNNVRNLSGFFDPFLSCYLNGVKMLTASENQMEENSWKICGFDNLIDTNHNLTFNVSSKLGQTFWLDYVVYLPSIKSTAPNDSLIQVSYSDSSLDYDNSWQPWNNHSMITRTANSTLRFRFTGTAIAWYGTYVKDFPSRPSDAIFSIDGGDPNTFRLLSTNVSSSAYNQLLFRSNIYPYGQHNMTVTFKGNNDTIPLTLDHLLVSTGNNSQQTSIPLLVDASAGRSFSTAVIGLICGMAALAVIVAALLFYILINRKKDRTKEGVVASASIPANESSTTPFPAKPSRSTSHHFDLASSSPYETVAGENHTWQPWYKRLTSLFTDPFNRKPCLGMVITNDERQPERESPFQVKSRWARSNQRPQIRLEADRGVVPTMAETTDEFQSLRVVVTTPETTLPGILSPNQPTTPHTGVSSGLGEVPTPTSQPSVTFTPSSAASYYGGYRTKRDMIELERRQKQH